MTLHTKRKRVDAHSPEPEIIQAAATIIQNGGLVAFPTETVYGLGSDALNAQAVQQIFKAKERPASDPIIVHIADPADLAQLTDTPSPLANQLAHHFWPGPLTLIVPKGAIVPSVVTAGGPTVAVRCPGHPVARALIKAANTPIAAPSANRFSRTSPTTAQHVWDDLAGRVDLILDGGAASIGIESTVLDITQEPPVVLRPGGLTVEALTSVIGGVAVQSRYVDTDKHEQQKGSVSLPSPGLLDRHYAPRAELHLFTGTDSEIRSNIQAALKQANHQGWQVGLLLASEDVSEFQSSPGSQAIVGSLANLATVAQKLFNTMRTLDTTETTHIFARDFPPEGLGLAIRDRLRRAARQII